MPSDWILRVKKYATDNGVTYKQALIECKGTNGGSQYAGYIQKLLAENEITKDSFKKIKNPSKWLIKRYGSAEDIFEEPVEKNDNDTEFVHQPLTLESAHPHPAEIQPEYDDINLGEIKSKKKKSKKKSTTSSSSIQSEEEAERKARIRSATKRLDSLSAEYQKYNEERLALHNAYTQEIEQLRKLRQTKKNKELYDQRIKQDKQDKKDLKAKYPKIVDYAKKNGLNLANPKEMHDAFSAHLAEIR